MDFTNFSFPNPSKKIKIAMIIAIIIIMVIVITDIVKKHNADKKDKNQNAENVLSIQDVVKGNVNIKRTGTFSNIDTDEDGLFDWEEELRGTNPNNKDTDEDGTEDKDEINQNRNPLLAGPDDVLILPETEIDELFSNITYKEGTLSDQVGKTFMENYLKIGRNNSTQLNQFSEQLASEAAIVGKLPEKYSEINFRTFPNFEEDRVREYGNLFALYTIDYRVAFSNINLNAPNFLERINTVLDTYATRLGNLAVPRGAVAMHTTYANNIVKLNAIYKILDKSEDPLRAYYAVGQYEIISEEMPFLYRDIAAYFENSGIIFTDEELGIFWQKI